MLRRNTSCILDVQDVHLVFKHPKNVDSFTSVDASASRGGTRYLDAHDLGDRVVCRELVPSLPLGIRRYHHDAQYSYTSKSSVHEERWPTTDSHVP